MQPTFSIIAPVYNESESLKELYRRIKEVLDTTQEPWELVLVDDGSQDGSTAIITELAKQDERVRPVIFARNFGHQIAVTAGLDYSSHRIGDARRMPHVGHAVCVGPTGQRRARRSPGRRPHNLLLTATRQPALPPNCTDCSTTPRTRGERPLSVRKCGRRMESRLRVTLSQSCSHLRRHDPNRSKQSEDQGHDSDAAKADAEVGEDKGLVVFEDLA